MSDKSTPQPMRGPSVPGDEVKGPADLVVRMNESTSEDWEMVPLPARQQLGYKERYQGDSDTQSYELKDAHGMHPAELLHSRQLSGGDPDSSLNLVEAVTYHLEATPPPAEPAGAPGTSGYNNLNRGVPAAEGFEHPADFTLEQRGNVQTFRLPEGVALDEGEQAKVDGVGPYAPGEVRVHGDPRNQSDDTRQRTVQTPSVNDPYRNPDGSLKDPREVHAAAPAYPDSEFGSQVQLAETVEPAPAVEVEGAKTEPVTAEEATAAAAADDGGGGSGDVPDGTVAEVMEWVGEDKGRARTALEAEQGREEPRSTLVSRLNNLL